MVGHLTSGGTIKDEISTTADLDADRHKCKQAFAMHSSAFVIAPGNASLHPKHSAARCRRRRSRPSPGRRPRAARMQSDDGGIPGMGVSPGNPPPGSPPFGPLRAASAGEVEALLSAIDTGDSAARLRALLATRPLLAEDAAPVVERMFAVDELSPLARGFACLFLGYKPTSRSRDLLTGVVENPREMPEVVGNAVAALGYARDPAAMPLCLRLLRADATHWSVRVASAVALGVLAEANPDARALVFDDLAQAFEKAEREDPLKQALVGALGDARDGRAVPLIAEYVAEAEAGEDFFMAQCACEALGKLPCAESERVLQAVVDDGTRHVNVHWAAEIALGAVQEALRG